VTAIFVPIAIGGIVDFLVDDKVIVKDPIKELDDELSVRY